MNDKSQSPPIIPLEAAQRIHRTCEQFEDAWSGLARPQLDTFLHGAVEPERSWLLSELLALDVELRRSAGEQPAEPEYQESFPSAADREVIAAAFQRCAISEDEANSSKKAGVLHVEGYEILGVLGRGGMGVVYKARDQRLKRLVALKMILAGEHAGAAHRGRFRAEAEMVARLQHPNIVQIFDVGEQDGHPFIAFEFIEGQTLADFAGREPQPARIAAELLEAMARAVQYAHQQGIVHRDLKPANILLANGDLSSSARSQTGFLERGGSVFSTSRAPSSALGSGMSGQHATSTGLVPKITDFGLAKDLAANLDHTSTGTILGTPNYMSPEQAEGKRDIGPSSDIYALGAILYVLLTGRPPFQGTSAIEMLKMVVNTEPVPPSQLLPHLARDAETICLKCLHKDPARRYETAGELADDLRRFLNHEAILARASGWIEKTWRWCWRNPSISALLASVLLVLVAGIVVSGCFAYAASEEAKTALQAEKKAGEEKTRADANAQRARVRAYGSDLRLAQRAWEDNLMDLFNELLEGQRPARTDDVDVRGFEWHYWRRLAGASTVVTRQPGTVLQVCFSPDGKRLASAGIDQTVKVWDVATGKETVILKGHIKATPCVCFSPDGKRLATAGENQTVKVWDAETGQEILTLQGHAGGVLSVCFSPDGKRLVSASEDHMAKVWDAATGQETLTLKGHTARVSSVCFSPNGKRIVSGSWDHTAKVWDAETGQEKLTLKGHGVAVVSVCYSPDGKRIASGGIRNNMKVWDAEMGEEKLTLDGSANGVGFSPDGKRVANACNGQIVRVWNTETGQLVLTLQGHTGQVNGLCFSPDGKHLASGSSDRTVRVWDIAELEARVRVGHQSQVTGLAVSPNGRWLASSGGVWDVGTSRYSAGELRLWDTDSGGRPRDLAVHSSGVTCVGFSPDGRYLASGSGIWDDARKRYTGGEVRLSDLASGAPLGCLTGHTSSVLCLALSPDSRFLASAGMAGDVLVRRLSSPLPQGDGPGVRVEDALTLPRFGTTLAFSPDGRFLVGGGIGGVVKVWNLTERTEVASLPALGVVFSVAFSPDGKQLAVGNGQDLLIFDTTTQKELRRLQGHLVIVTHVVYSPDGRRIASASENGEVRLWDSSSGQAMLSLHGHTGVVRCVEFSPDGHRLYSGGWDRSIRVWDATPVD